jgi:hypothetical protein
MWAKIRFGSNVVSGTAVARTALLASGMRLFDVATRPDGSIVVSGDLYDAHGRRFGSLLANTWAQRQTATFVRAETERVTVHVGESVVLDVRRRDTELVISAMTLHTREGRHWSVDDRRVLTVEDRRGNGETRTFAGEFLTAPLDRIDLASAFVARPNTIQLDGSHRRATSP